MYLQVRVDPATLLPTDLLDPRALHWLAALGVRDCTTVQDLLASPAWPQVEAAIQAGLDRANDKAISNVARVRKWKVVGKEFSMDGGELGPSLKLKRFHVVDKYKEEIDAMYAQ